MLRIIAIIASMLIASAAYGWDKSIHIEWGYTPPSDLKVTGFKLYQDGKEACSFLGADIRKGDCNVYLGQAVTSFTLQATFADGTASPHSAPFKFSDPGPGPSIIILVGKSVGG